MNPDIICTLAVCKVTIPYTLALQSVKCQFIYLSFDLHLFIYTSAVYKYFCKYMTFISKALLYKLKNHHYSLQKRYECML